MRLLLIDRRIVLQMINVGHAVHFVPSKSSGLDGRSHVNDRIGLVLLLVHLADDAKLILVIQLIVLPASFSAFSQLERQI